MGKFLIHGEKDDYEIVVGLEVHAQVNSQSKLFSGSSTNFGFFANINISVLFIFAVSSLGVYGIILSG